MGYITRAGFVTKNGEGEAVQGLVLGLKGANVGTVLDEVKSEISRLEPMLPNGTKIDISFAKRIGTGLFGGEGFILEHLEGDGLAFIHAGGTVIKKELNGDKIKDIYDK